MSTHQDKLLFPQGKVLVLIAGQYPDVHRVILEQVQNALDAMDEKPDELNRIGVILDKKKRRATIRDNGKGVTIEEFAEALKSVAVSSKTKTLGKLGQFGLGLISPLGKCERFTFTSCSREGGGFNRWEFVTKDIQAQADEIQVPRKPMPNMVYRAKKREGTVQWRTQVDIIDYSSDRTIGHIGSVNDLKDSILGRYGATMRRKKVRLDLQFTNEDGSASTLLDVMAAPYDGEALPKTIVNERRVGAVHFDLYLARKGAQGTKGVVHVGQLNNEYAFRFSDMARSARKWLSSEVVKALNSGLFEGDIKAEKATLNPDRVSFVENDAYVAFCKSIDKWYAEHGMHYVKAAEEDKRDERYQNVAREALENILSMLDQPQFAAMRQLLDTLGTGAGAEGAGDRSLLADVPEPKANDPKGKGSSTTQSGDSPKTRAKSSVRGPAGAPRTMVKCKGINLQVAHIEMLGTPRLWELDCTLGVLYLNITHPAFVLCDKGTRRLAQLHEYVMVQALTLQTMPEDWREHQLLYAEEASSFMASVFAASKAFTMGRHAKDESGE
jgi:hypothetical protein